MFLTSNGLLAQSGLNQFEDSKDTQQIFDLMGPCIGWAELAWR